MPAIQSWFTRHDRSIQIGLTALSFGLFVLAAGSSLGLVPRESVFYSFRPHQFTALTGAMLLQSLTAFVRPQFMGARYALLGLSVLALVATAFLRS